MGFFKSFGKRASRSTPEPAEEKSSGPDLHSGMRAEVMSMDNNLLFVGKLIDPQGNCASLLQYTESVVSQNTEPLNVKLRSYNEDMKIALLFEGTITPGENKIWHAENLVLVRSGNERAFFRVDTDIDAELSPMGRIGSAGHEHCRLLNLSVGGALIGSSEVHEIGDRFLLKVKLLPERDISTMYCQILRIVSRDNGKFEYGCRFLEMHESEKDNVSQIIFDLQLKRKNETKD